MIKALNIETNTSMNITESGTQAPTFEMLRGGSKSVKKGRPLYPFRDESDDDNEVTRTRERSTEEIERDQILQKLFER